MTAVLKEYGLFVIAVTIISILAGCALMMARQGDGEGVFARTQTERRLAVLRRDSVSRFGIPEVMESKGDQQESGLIMAVSEYQSLLEPLILCDLELERTYNAVRASCSMLDIARSLSGLSQCECGVAPVMPELLGVSRAELNDDEQLPQIQQRRVLQDLSNCRRQLLHSAEQRIASVLTSSGSSLRSRTEFSKALVVILFTDYIRWTGLVQDRIDADVLPVERSREAIMEKCEQSWCLTDEWTDGGDVICAGRFGGYSGTCYEGLYWEIRFLVDGGFGSFFFEID